MDDISNHSEEDLKENEHTMCAGKLIRLIKKCLHRDGQKSGSGTSSDKCGCKSSGGSSTVNRGTGGGGFTGHHGNSHHRCRGHSMSPVSCQRSGHQRRNHGPYCANFTAVPLAPLGDSKGANSKCDSPMFSVLHSDKSPSKTKPYGDPIKHVSKSQ